MKQVEPTVGETKQEEPTVRRAVDSVNSIAKSHIRYRRESRTISGYEEHAGLTAARAQDVIKSTAKEIDDESCPP